MSTFRRGRLTPFGIPQPARLAPSLSTTFVPALGVQPSVPALIAPEGSMVSAQNTWVREGGWEPRYRLAQAGTTSPFSVAVAPTGALVYDAVEGGRYDLVASAATLSYLDGMVWRPLTYVSGVSNLPPSGGARDFWFGSSIYLERQDANVLAFTNGVDPLYVWDGPSNGTGYSTLTGAPICADLALFDNRPVCWNIGDLSTSSRLVQRVQWSVRGDIEDWADIGSGFEDLLDMRGEGTRIFAEEDELILFSTEEIWRGRKVGLPFVFQFAPVTHELGLPYPRAALQTVAGIFWLGRDRLVRRLVGGAVTEVGGTIQRDLHATLQSPDLAFLTWNGALRQLALWYTTTQGQHPNRNWTLHIDTGQWTPHTFAHTLALGAAYVATPSSATTWGGLTGTVAAQTLTYNELLGLGLGQTLTDGVVASTGTAYALTPSANSDDGQAVLSEWQVPVLTGERTRQKLVDAVRLEAEGGTNSTLSVVVTTDFGRTVGTERLLTFDANGSTVSQYVLHPTAAPGAHLALRFRSSSVSTWRVAGATVEAKLRGRTT